MSLAVDAINRIRQSQRTEQKTGRRLLWNASPEVVTFRHNADEYAIPPNGPGKMREDKAVKAYDGVLEVYDVYGIDPQQAQAARKATKEARKNGESVANVLEGYPKRVVVSSLDICEHAVRKLANRGVVALTGDPAEDKELREAATLAWTEFRRAECEKILELYDIKKAAFYAQPRNVDQPPPPMTQRETAAFVWLADWRLGLSMGTSKLTCKAQQCPFQHEDADIMTKHVLAYHPTLAAQMAEDANSAAEEREPEPEEPQKRGPGRPRKNAA